MENVIQVRARNDANAAHIAEVFSNFLSSGDVKLECIVLGKDDNGIYNFLVEGGQEDDRETETVC